MYDQKPSPSSWAGCTVALMIIAFVLFTAITASAQGFSEVQTSSKSSSEPITITVDGKKFNGDVTSSGNVWIMRKSVKSGKEYRQYLGADTKRTFSKAGKEYPVFVKNHRDGTKSFYYYTIGKTGFPSQHKLTAD
jgi:hypothetical protein